MTAFLQYWKPEIADYNLERGGLFQHSGSEQLKRLNVGDTLWVATVFDGALTLIGRLSVDHVVGTEEAVRILGTDDLWEATHHAISTDDPEPLLEIDISGIADQLRFESSRGRNRLDVTQGGISAQQLQTMRRLTADCAALLEETWRLHLTSDTGEAGPDLRSDPDEQSGAGFGNHESNEVIEERAIALAREYLVSAGWSVRSVEQDRIGYDLRCTMTGQELHVEVRVLAEAKRPSS